MKLKIKLSDEDEETTCHKGRSLVTIETFSWLCQVSKSQSSTEIDVKSLACSRIVTADLAQPRNTQ